MALHIWKNTRRLRHISQPIGIQTDAIRQSLREMAPSHRATRGRYSDLIGRQPAIWPAMLASLKAETQERPGFRLPRSRVAHAEPRFLRGQVFAGLQ
jgi:hypothetical protein